MLASIFLFLFLTLSFGSLACSFVKLSGSSLERLVIRLGIGLACVIPLGVLLNLFGIIIDWKIFASLALVADVAVIVWKRKELLKYFSSAFSSWSFKITKEDLFASLALFIFALSLFMYASGSLSYPYLENEDPWSHAFGTSFIAHEKTLLEPENYRLVFLDPYPPGYEMWLGILHQVEPSVSWVLKFFNSLFIALGILFFYFMMRSLQVERTGAIFATFVLSALPSFFTHFIWAHTLSIILVFIAIYSLEMISLDKRWATIAALVISAIFLTHPDEGLKIAVMIVLYLAVKSLYLRKVQLWAVAGFLGGAIISLLWWAERASTVLTKHTSTILISAKYSAVQSAQGTVLGAIQKYFPPNQGTATRAYTFSDFVFAKPFGMINVHVGWGLVISLLLLFSLLYIIWRFSDFLHQKNYWMGVAVIWFIFTFLGTNSMTFDLPLGLYAFRFWLLLAIPVAMLSWLGAKLLLSLGRKLRLPYLGAIIIIILVIGIFFTSAAPKYNQNAKTQWPPGVSWSNLAEIQLYIWLKNALPPGTSVFSFRGKGSEIIGMDKFSCEWCIPVRSFRGDITNTTADKLYTFLKSEQYQYFVFEISSIKLWTAQNISTQSAVTQAEHLLNSLSTISGLELVQQFKDGGLIFKVS